MIGVKSICSLLFIFCLNVPYAFSDSDNSEVRTVKNINSDWEYLENNSQDINEINLSENWKSINLPHTWNQWDVMDPNPGYRRDASWYRKTIYIEERKNVRYKIYFEGANITSDVYVNGNYVDQHVGGYVGFEYDISKWVKKGQQNSISVRVDNSYNRDIIPSQKADFFIYGGITRDVWLKIVPDLNIDKVFIKTDSISNDVAITSLKINIDNKEQLDNSHSLRSIIKDSGSGKIVSVLTIPSNEYDPTKFYSFPKILNPKLWSPKTPNLYYVESTIIKDDKIIDRLKERIGLRWYEFKPYGAFYLNGKRLLLRGTHRHEEHAGYGSAMPNSLHRKDIKDMDDMGANFLRLGHYPQDPSIYEACDELGIIVWDELPWCRGGMGGTTWQNNTSSFLKKMITQNYNHPSIFFWSLGNEIYWLPDFEDGDNETRLNAYLKSLHELAHKLDPSRMTAIRKYYAGADIVDVFSPSIWSGWYAGVYKNYGNTIDKNQKKYPHFLHMEYGGSSHVGRHTETPITGDGLLNEDDWAEVSNQVDIVNIAKSGDWTENYIVDLFDWYLSVSETHEGFAGNAQWAFKDFGTPLRPENAIPYVNQKGLVDRDGKPKDAYYVFKSYWSEIPFTYIESHTWKERSGPQNKTRNVAVFSNCSEVELVLNDISKGTKKRVLGNFPACGLNWDVVFKEGQNVIISIGNSVNGEVVTDTLTINYTYSQAEKADHINLSYRDLENGNLLVEAKMYDSKGNRVLDYEKPMYFSHDGASEFYVNYGTPTRSQIIQMANGYAAIELKKETNGIAIIEARNQDFKGSYLKIDFGKLQKVDLGN